MLEQFKELEDRFEKEFEYNPNNVLVSIDKDDVSDLSDEILNYLISELSSIMSDALDYFEKNKEKYEVSYIDDLSDPQIILGSDNFSVFWWSDKGEKKGDAIIGVDYSWPKVEPQGLTIGD